MCVCSLGGAHKEYFYSVKACVSLYRMVILCREGKLPFLRSLQLKAIRVEKTWDYDLTEISQKCVIYPQIIPLQIL